MNFNRGNLKMALQSIHSSKWRSRLTMFGIIVGIVSVVTVVSIGQGIKNEIAGQIGRLGQDVLTIRPGNVSASASQTLHSLTGYLGATTVSVLSTNDIGVVQHVPTVSEVVPLSIVPGAVQINSGSHTSLTVIGTNAYFPQVLNDSLEYGQFLPSADTNLYEAVIGYNLANKLFGSSAPLGQYFNFRGQQFIVGGVLNPVKVPPLSLQANFNNTIFIPYSTAVQMENGNAPLYELLAKTNNTSDVSKAKRQIIAALTAAHGGEQDFSVLTADQSVNVSNGVLNLLTSLIGAIAAISLVVGGIGIMNVMLVSVTERTREIGIRKAIGATNRQIRSQFLIEAIVLSIAGAIWAILLSLLINLVLRLTTSLQPALTWQIMLIAIGVSIAVGIIFGIIPALKAAHKDPIQALRNE